MHDLAPASASHDRPGHLVRAAAFFELTKPRIAVLLLITLIAAMFCAQAGLPSVQLIAVTSLGFFLTSGGASALNHVVDRDIDALMERTKRRPVVDGTIAPLEGTVFGIALMAAGTLLIGYSQAGWLAALLALFGGVFYAVVYTMILKRRTVQNIVIGGAAGAIPPLVGWTAVSGELSGIAWLLFAIVFLWTPPHFWSLALLVGDQYTRAGVPMMPGVRGARRTANQIVVYTVVLLAASVGGGLLVGGLGWIYLASAAVLGLRFLQRAVQLRWAVLNLDDPDQRGRVTQLAETLARKTFLYSMLYLALIFAAAVADRLVLS